MRWGRGSVGGQGARLKGILHVGTTRKGYRWDTLYVWYTTQSAVRGVSIERERWRRDMIEKERESRRSGALRAFSAPREGRKEASVERFFARNPQTMHNDVCHGQRKHSIKEMSRASCWITFVSCRGTTLTLSPISPPPFLPLLRTLSYPPRAAPLRRPQFGTRPRF